MLVRGLFDPVVGCQHEWNEKTGGASNPGPSNKPARRIYPEVVFCNEEMMTHAVAEKQKLLNRVRRLRGQVEALERALDAEVGCVQIMQQLTAARGAISALMAEVVEDHIRMHMVDSERIPTARESEAAEELVSVMHSYIK